MSDLFFLAFIPLCFLVPVSFFLVLFILSRRKKAGAIASGGTKPGPAQSNPLLKRIADRLFEEMGLPSQEFRRELGVKYPELAMAFRQSVNSGVIRYARQHWHREPDEALLPDLLNRLICDYYGFVLPVPYTAEHLKDGLGAYFKQKKILYNVQLEPTAEGQSLVILHKKQVLWRMAAVPRDVTGLLRELQSLASQLEASGQWQAYAFRDTDTELGVIFVTPPEYQSRLAALAQVPAGVVSG